MNADRFKGQPLIERKGRFYLRKSFDKRQREFPLGSDLGNAITRSRRFLATYATSGLDTAVLELTGKKVVKAGSNPTFEEMEILYRDFCRQSVKSPAEITIKTNLKALKRIMETLKISTVANIDVNNLYTLWFKGIKNITTSNKRTFSGIISQAGSIFKVTALAYYQTRSITLTNPFKGMEKLKPAIQPYIPISKELRESIWNDCQTELKPTEAMIILLALGGGLRRGEIECIKLDWFTIQKDSVTITIQETDYFTPKVNETGVVTIPLDLYKTLIALRGESDCDFFIPNDSKVTGKGRLQAEMRIINSWLKKKGFKNQKALHDLRKEYGSHIAKTQSILAASKALRNTVHVAGIHYAGIAEIDLVDIQDSFKVEKTPEELLAEKMGISLEELQKRLNPA